MIILKRMTAMFLASAIAFSGGVNAFAENGETAIVEAVKSTDADGTDSKPETAVIGTAAEGTAKPETAITDPAADGTAKLETSIVGEDENETQKPESGVDLSDIDYTPIDVSGYTLWDGKTAMQEGQNYYITGDVKLRNSFVVPAGVQLVITPGAKITMYMGKFLNVKGSIVIEPKSELLYSGDFYLGKGASLENYGEIKATVSSKTHISGEYIVRQDSKVTYSGQVNIYKDGMYVNYGVLNVTQNSKMLVTGDFQTPVGGRLMLRGSFGITISGRATFAGGLYIYGQLTNSGVLVLEKSVRYYKTKGIKLIVSKSSRLIDYRYYNPTSDATDKGTKGIDVSYAQGAIDWAEVRKSGVSFAMLRASRGYISEEKPMAQDKTFEYNITQAQAYGIDVGVYHYLYADNVEDAIKEAQFLLKTIEPYRITYPVVLDVEEQYQADLGKEKITEICKAFLMEVAKAGYYPMIYANKDWLMNHLDMNELAGYDVWLAQWNTVPTYSGSFGMWQYSSKGIVSGIDGYVDLNISYKDYAMAISQNGYNNLKNDIA